MNIYEFLDHNQIEYQRFDHPAVFTCEEAAQLVPEMLGIKSKNLFVRDRRGKRHILLIVPAYKTVDLKATSKALGVSGLGFASPERLMKHLGVEAGSVSFLSIFNNIEGTVEVVFDQTVWDSEHFQCHPLVNTSTLLIPHADVVKILERTKHPYHIIDVPQRI
ncbi:prolyl-tRNA synthetase associated domain-containing protein [Pseudomonadota bacterium]